MFVSRMTNNCSLRHWRTNSRVEHAVSPNMTGPYTFSDVALPVWAHNPDILALPDGTFALIHIGAGSGSASGGDICHNDVHFLEQEEDEQVEERTRRRGSNIHTSHSLYGPWAPLESTTGPCNNPSVWINQNRSLLLLCFVSNGLFDLKIADNISGPWHLLTTIDVNHLVRRTQPTSNPNNFLQVRRSNFWAGAAFEDPALWRDRRGHFHILCHAYRTTEERGSCENSTVAAHLFSRDGLSWSISEEQPFTTRILTRQGSRREEITVSTR